MQKKYLIEKVVHELIRDLPEARRISQQYENGLIATEDCLRELATILEAVRRGCGLWKVEIEDDNFLLLYAESEADAIHQAEDSGHDPLEAFEVDPVTYEAI